MLNREEKRKRIKAVRIMGKRLSRSQRKYIYKESVKEEIRRIGNEMIEEISGHGNVKNVSYDIAKTYQRALFEKSPKSKYF